MSRLPGHTTEVAIPELRLEARLRDLEARLIDAEKGLTAIEAPTVPTLATNWSSFDAGVNFTIPSFYKRAGRVHLTGLAKKSIAVVAGETIFTLPAGYRPDKQLVFPIISSGVIGRLDVSPAGAVILQSGNASYVSFEGVSFRAA